MARKVTIFSNVSQSRKEVSSSATTWGGLQEDLRRAGVPYQDMKAVIGETQHTLESSEASLPESDFYLFLVPNKVKSGSWEDDEDEGLIDWEDGIEWNEETWDNESNNIGDYSFKTEKDLAIARLQKSKFYIEQAINALVEQKDGRATRSADPEIDNLKKTADNITRNLGIFD